MSIIEFKADQLSVQNSVELRIKNNISNDKELWNSLSKLDSESEIFDCLMKSCSDMTDDPCLESSVMLISKEIIELRKDPGTYVLDDGGKPLFKLTNEMIYSPDPVLNEDGSLRKIAPRLHPKLSSGIALALHERKKFHDLEKRFPQNPAIMHLKDPWLIVESAYEELRKIEWIKIIDEPSLEAEDLVIEVGKENINSVFQSFNPKFIRASIFGKSLARQIRAIRTSKIKIVSCERRSNSSLSWYDVTIKYEK